MARVGFRPIADIPPFADNGRMDELFVTKTIAVLAALPLLAIGITMKADAQFVDLLEGKMQRLGKPTKGVRHAYKKHARASSVVAYLFGMWLFFLAFAVTNKSLGVGLGLLGVVLLGVGVMGRVRTFYQAERELS
jgi:hypothetical protein